MVSGSLVLAVEGEELGPEVSVAGTEQDEVRTVPMSAVLAELEVPVFMLTTAELRLLNGSEMTEKEAEDSDERRLERFIKLRWQSQPR
jgi:hypothetical protein